MNNMDEKNLMLVICSKGNVCDTLFSSPDVNGKMSHPRENEAPRFVFFFLNGGVYIDACFF